MTLYASTKCTRFENLVTFQNSEILFLTALIHFVYRMDSCSSPFKSQYRPTSIHIQEKSLWELMKQIKSNQILYLDTQHPGALKFSLKRVRVYKLENLKFKKKNYARNLYITTVKILAINRSSKWLKAESKTTTIYKHYTLGHVIKRSLKWHNDQRTSINDSL